MKKNKKELLQSLPPQWKHSLLPEIRKQVIKMGRSIVVLDDDPTGTQTVHGVPVLTTWDSEWLIREFRNQSPVFFILTNSRSCPSLEAQAINKEICDSLLLASSETNQGFVIVSRSDSTLRGHFPDELFALEGATRVPVDGWLVHPFFEEGGRITVGDIHYVVEGDYLVSVDKTEFARDHAFGYRSSDLKDWVEEKSRGEMPASDVMSISIEHIRNNGPEGVADVLMGLSSSRVCIVNSVNYRDVEVFVQGVMIAESRGKNFLYRTASSFVRTRAGIKPNSLIGKHQLDLDSKNGALFIIGSHVMLTTVQLSALLRVPEVRSVELRVEKLFEDHDRLAEIARVTNLVDDSLQSSRDTVVYTSRDLIAGGNDRCSLSVGREISRGIVEIVSAISIQPRYILAKGGITSSDVATHALGIKRAEVVGQIQPGVPVWKLGNESKFPGVAYIVFPGNVGEADSLVKIQKNLSEVE